MRIERETRLAILNETKPKKKSTLTENVTPPSKVDYLLSKEYPSWKYDAVELVKKACAQNVYSTTYPGRYTYFICRKMLT